MAPPTICIPPFASSVICAFPPPEIHHLPLVSPPLFDRPPAACLEPSLKSLCPFFLVPQSFFIIFLNMRIGPVHSFEGSIHPNLGTILFTIGHPPQCLSFHSPPIIPPLSQSVTFFSSPLCGTPPLLCPCPNLVNSVFHQ